MRIFTLSLLTLFSAVCSSVFAQGNQAEIKFDLLQTPIDAQVIAAFSDKTHLELVKVPLSKVCEAISKAHDVEIRIDTWALDDVALTSDTPITFSTSKAIKLETALQLILNELDLTFIIDQGVLVITTPEEAEGQGYPRYYQLSSMTNQPDVRPELMIKFITNFIELESWEQLGGPGAIEPVMQGIIVSQTFQIHKKVVHFLTEHAKLEREYQANPYNRERLKVLHVDPRENETIQAVLEKQMDQVSFKDTPLSDVATTIGKSVDLSIVIDRSALDDVALSSDTPVTMEFASGHTVHYVLTRMLEPLDLTLMTYEDVLMITTPDEAESELAIRIFPLIGPPLVKREDQARWLTAITSTVEPESWSMLGGPGEIGYDPSIHSLVVAQTEGCHEKVAQLLDQIFLSNFSAASRQKPIPVRASRTVKPIRISGSTPVPKPQPQLQAQPQISNDDPFGPPQQSDPFGN